MFDITKILISNIDSTLQQLEETKKTQLQVLENIQSILQEVEEK